MEEIDIKDLIKKVWKARKVVLFMTLFFMGIGWVVIYSLPVVYEASVTLMPNISMRNGGSESARNLASMVGIEFLDTKVGEQISILTYEDIIESTPFLIALNKRLAKLEKLKEIVHEPEKDSLHSPPSLIRYPYLDYLASLTDIDIDKSKGFFKIVSKTESALFSFILTREIHLLLSKFIDEIIKEKIDNQLSTLKNSLKNSKARFRYFQERLSDYKDKNRSLSTSMSRMGLKTLEDEYELSYQLYSGTLRQLETNRNTLSLNHTFFSVIEPAIFNPLPKSRDYAKFVILGFALLGALIGIIYSLTKDLFLSAYRFLKNNL